ncbi:MAG: HEAT repeat domain-containing protein [bacterium]
MKKQHYYWIAAALVIIGLAVGLFLWKSKRLTGTKAEAPIAEEAKEPQIVLRELRPVKADEEKFFEAVRRLAGAAFDSLSDEQKLDALLQLADDAETTNRLLAVQKLGEMETADNRRVDKLIAKLQDENSWVVEAAVLALTRLRPAQAVEPLRRLYADLQKQPQTEYVPFANTAFMAVHGQINEASEKTDFNFQLTSFAKSDNAQTGALNDREKIALFILPDFEMCWSLPNFQDNWEKLQNSQFAKQLVQLQAWQDFKAAAPFNRFFKLQEKLNTELSSLGGQFNALIDPMGDEVYVATYPAAEGNSYLLVTPANLKAQGVNTALKALGKVRSGELTIEKQEYRGQSLFQISVDKKASLLHYAVVEGYLVIADDRQLLVRAIASYLNKDESSLAYQPAFRQSHQQVGKASFLVGYVEPEKFFGFKKGRQISSTLTATVESALREITGEAVTMSPAFSSAETVAAASAVEPQTLRFIPANAIFSYATTAINPQPFWRYVTTMRAEKEAIKAFETRSNLNLGHDLISKIDNQLLYFFAGIDTTGPRFFWRQLLGVRLRDTKGVEQYGKRLLAYLYSPKEEIQIEEYNGARIHYVKNPTTFEPNFSIGDGYLLMAFDRPTLRAAIDAGQKRADSIEQNASFVATRNRLNVDENSLAYFNAENFLDNYRSYLLAYDRVTNLFDQSDLQLRIDPLFALIKSTAEIGAGKFNAEGKGEMVIGMK